MRRVIFIAALAGSIVLARVSPAGIYLAFALVFAFVFGLLENLISREAPTAEVVTPVIEEGSAPVLRFRCNKMCRGMILAENTFTRQRREIPFIAKQSKDISLPPFDTCGQLRSSFVILRRFDLCGLTSKAVKCEISGIFRVMPKPELPCDIDPERAVSGECELSGAREYSQGDELKRINFKLTHRFSKIYINTFSPEENSLLCLFFDLACPDDTAVSARQLRVFAGVSRALSAQGIDHCAAFSGENGFKVMRGAKSSLEDILAAIIGSKTEKAETTLYSFLNDSRSAELGRIICITAHPLPETERVLPVIVSKEKG